MSVSATSDPHEADLSEPQPWRTPEDAQGWRIAGVGRRHPRWLEFEIAAIAYQHDPMGLVGNGTPSDIYRPAARIVADRLRTLDPELATGEDVSFLTQDVFNTFYADRPSADQDVYRSMAEQVLPAWRAFAARLASPNTVPSPVVRSD